MVLFADLSLPVACLVAVAGEGKLHGGRGACALEVACTAAAARRAQDTQPQNHDFHGAENTVTSVEVPRLP